MVNPPVSSLSGDSCTKFALLTGGSEEVNSLTVNLNHLYTKVDRQVGDELLPKNRQLAYGEELKGGASNWKVLPVTSNAQTGLEEATLQEITRKAPFLTSLTVIDVTLSPGQLYRLLHSHSKTLSELSLKVILTMDASIVRPEKARSGACLLQMISGLSLKSLALSLDDTNFWNSPIDGRHLDSHLKDVLGQLESLHWAKVTDDQILYGVLSQTDESKLTKLSLVDCSLPPKFDLFENLLTLKPSLASTLTHLSVVYCNVDLVFGINMGGIRTLCNSFFSLRHLDLSIEEENEITFLAILPCIAKLKSLKYLGVRAFGKSNFLKDDIAENAIQQARQLGNTSVTSLRLDCKIHLGAFPILPIVFPRVEKLYIEKSTFFLPEVDYVELKKFLSLISNDSASKESFDNTISAFSYLNRV